MSYRLASRKSVAALSVAGSWSDQDVVLEGTDGRGEPLRLCRAEALVPAALVRRWLLVRDARGQHRLKVVREFVSREGILFTPAPATHGQARERLAADPPDPDAAASP